MAGAVEPVRPRPLPCLGDPPEPRPRRRPDLRGGSNLAALLAACESEAYGARIVGVGADRHSAAGLELARERGIPTFVERVGDHPERVDFDRALTARVAELEPDLVVSAGFLKLVGADFLAVFAGRYVNTHNSLLPAFPGMQAPADALAHGVKVAGATLFVVDEGVDAGPIIAQTVVDVRDDDDLDTLTERIKVAERAQLVDVVGRMARGGWRVEGRRVLLG
ncbi:phosphoribosylglycinamide formyltransferase [Litorihabitans aurantiacus]|uniref:Phosphoribosylglycinamide formyltransferase n=1 Tax=Litorihabitans aurantiacus TaxID=1930061 RepID=A0AA38CQA6_9MICO|nr:phosphoribosylglycinamide formyltransferase [Litorihabitans aurantiacus]GMA32198.1 phosphoribosylglycinamide formyltransferase [Litorihabitans aurantiacus]